MNKLLTLQRFAVYFTVRYALRALILITASRSLVFAVEGTASTTMQVIVPSQVVATTTLAVPPMKTSGQWVIPFSAQGRMQEAQDHVKVSVEISKGDAEGSQLPCQQKEHEVVCDDSPAWNVGSMPADKKSELQATMIFSDL